MLSNKARCFADNSEGMELKRLMLVGEMTCPLLDLFRITFQQQKRLLDRSQG